MKIFNNIREAIIVTLMSFTFVTSVLFTLVMIMFVTVGSIQLLQYLLGYS